MNPRFFLRNERGASFESMALALSVIAMLFVGAADLLHYASKKDGMLAQMFANGHTEIAGAAEGGQDGGVDYTPTSSIIGLRHRPTLDPCNGMTR
jgi:hypothetical protein